MKIVLIDDDDFYRQSLVDYLNDKGYAVFSSATGKCAFKLFERDEFDVLITDIVMPEQDGIEIIVAIKKIFPSIKIIAISGSDRQAIYLQIAEKIGADYILCKPFRNEELHTILQSLLSTVK